jgi:hypothetical protein
MRPFQTLASDGFFYKRRLHEIPNIQSSMELELTLAESKACSQATRLLPNSLFYFLCSLHGLAIFLVTWQLRTFVWGWLFFPCIYHVEAIWSLVRGWLLKSHSWVFTDMCPNITYILCDLVTYIVSNMWLSVIYILNLTIKIYIDDVDQCGSSIRHSYIAFIV